MPKDNEEGFHWQAVKVCNSISYDFFKRQYLNKKIPVVITNSVPHWSALEYWTPAYLEQKLGDKPVTANAHYFQNLNNEGDVYPFNSLIKQIENPGEIESPPYLRNYDIYTFLPELVEDIQPRLHYALPNWLTCRLIPQKVTDGLVELFIGGKGSAFPFLHIDSDGSNAFITQIFGNKVLIMFPPDQTESLHGLFGNPDKFSLEKLAMEISSGNPTALQLVGYKQTLSPGDTVFIPAGWWHTTLMNETSITVSTNNVNQSNWDAYIKSATSYNAGIKKGLKIMYLGILGRLLLMLDFVGQSDLISRPLDKH